MIGGILSAVNNVKQGYWQNAFNIINAVQSIRQNKLQKEAFEWQKYYDQNQTQIRVDDFAKAGLNPILASGATGASSVSGVSAQNVNAQVDSGQLDKLADMLDAKEQRAADKEISDDSLKTQKDIAKIQSDTAKSVAETNARTQETIATLNNEAQSGVRTSQQRFNDANSDKLEFENEYTRLYNKLTGRLDTPKTVAEIVSAGADKISAWLGVGVDKAKDFIDWLKRKDR